MKERSLRVFLIAFVLSGRALFGGDVPTPVAENPVYRERADKIVAKLELGAGEKEKSARVRDAIAAHYAAVNAVDDALQAKLKELKQSAPADKAAAEAAAKTARDEAQPKLDKAHADFLAKLSADLTPEQIDQVKDGMTYGVLQVTWRAYEKMLPDLTAEQKAQIMAWLKEAREHAVDAGSSDAKHAWFGKYKGKINNYLAKAGYDMKAAEKNLLKKP